MYKGVLRNGRGRNQARGPGTRSKSTKVDWPELARAGVRVTQWRPFATDVIIGYSCNVKGRERERGANCNGVYSGRLSYRVKGRAERRAEIYAGRDGGISLIIGRVIRRGTISRSRKVRGRNERAISVEIVRDAIQEERAILQLL